MRDSTPYADFSRFSKINPTGHKVNEPIEGYFRVRLRRASVFRGVQLVFGPPNDPLTGEVLDRSWRWQAILDDGSMPDFEDIWPVCAGEPITEEDYRVYCTRDAWARDNAPKSAFADPTRKYDPLSSQEPLPF